VKRTLTLVAPFKIAAAQHPRFDFNLSIGTNCVYGKYLAHRRNCRVNAFLLLGWGDCGVLSGMFCVGGGFLITPLLFFIGIPQRGPWPQGAEPDCGVRVFGACWCILKRKDG